MSRSSFNPTGRTQVARDRRALEDLLSRCEEVDAADPLRGDVNRYACVRLVGFLEQSLMSLADAACVRGSWGETQEFATSWLERVESPRAQAICKFVRRFSGQWGGDLEDYLQIDERGARLNSLVGIRNQVAHGRDQGISRLEDYFVLVEELVDWLQERFDPLPESAA